MTQLDSATLHLSCARQSRDDCLLAGARRHPATPGPYPPAPKTAPFRWLLARSQPPPFRPGQGDPLRGCPIAARPLVRPLTRPRGTGLLHAAQAAHRAHRPTRPSDGAHPYARSGWVTITVGLTASGRLGCAAQGRGPGRGSGCCARSQPPPRSRPATPSGTAIAAASDHDPNHRCQPAPDDAAIRRPRVTDRLRRPSPNPDPGPPRSSPPLHCRRIGEPDAPPCFAGGCI